MNKTLKRMAPERLLEAEQSLMIHNFNENVRVLLENSDDKEPFRSEKTQQPFSHVAQRKKTVSTWEEISAAFVPRLGSHLYCGEKPLLGAQKCSHLHQHRSSELRKIKIWKLKTQALRQRFQSLSSQWHKATDGSSSINRKLAHPAYREILSLGKGVVPFILEEMETRYGHWFDALAELTGKDPIPEDHYGDIQQMTQDWIQFRDSGHLIL